MIRNCHPTINEFFFADNIILVEGDTEQATLFQVKKEDTAILNCRGKANIPMFEKILNHFSMSYVAMHDLDSPKANRKGSWVQNSMWSINEKIYVESQKGKGNKVIVNIPDFEGQFFGYLQSGDKPYNAICELKKDENQSIVVELKRIADGDLSSINIRIIASTAQYTELGIKYCQEQDIEMIDK